jgi:hypothetical protein
MCTPYSLSPLDKCRPVLSDRRFLHVGECHHVTPHLSDERWAVSAHWEFCGRLRYLRHLQQLRNGWWSNRYFAFGSGLVVDRRYFPTFHVSHPCQLASNLIDDIPTRRYDLPFDVKKNGVEMWTRLARCVFARNPTIIRHRRIDVFDVLCACTDAKQTVNRFANIHEIAILNVEKMMELVTGRDFPPHSEPFFPD